MKLNAPKFREVFENTSAIRSISCVMSLSDTLPKFENLQAQFSRLLKKLPEFAAAEGKVGDFFEGKAVEPIEITDDSPAAEFVAETIVTLSEVIDETEARIDSTIGHTKGNPDAAKLNIKLIIALSLIFLLLVPEYIELAADVLRQMALSLKILISTGDPSLNFVVNRIEFIILALLAYYSKNKEMMSRFNCTRYTPKNSGNVNTMNHQKPLVGQNWQ